MPAAFDPERLLAALARHGVDFVLIGGLAASLHGSPATTNDADICPSRVEANVARLAQALVELDARIRTDRDPDGVAFDRSAAFIGAVDLLNLTTVAGDLDLAFEPSGLGGYEEVVVGAVAVDLGNFTVLVASLDDVIHSKEVADRPRANRAVLPLLKALRDEAG